MFGQRITCYSSVFYNKLTLVYYSIALRSDRPTHMTRVAIKLLSTISYSISVHYSMHGHRRQSTARFCQAGVAGHLQTKHLHFKRTQLWVLYYRSYGKVKVHK